MAHQNSPTMKIWTYTLYAYPVLYAVGGFVFVNFLHFHQFHNDFWDNVFVARHLDPHIPASWYCPLYPIGYHLFLKAIMGSMFPPIPAIIANIMIGSLYLYAAIFLCSRFLNMAWTAVIVIGLSIFPRFFWYVHAGGADPVSILFFLAGACLIVPALVDNRNGLSVRTMLVGGALLGLGSLSRYHVLPGSFLFLFSLALVYRRSFPRIAIAFIALCAVYSPQWIINVITGHGMLQTAFGVPNVYNLMYGTSWYQTVTLDLPSSIFPLVMKDPFLFFRNYAIEITRLSILFIPPLCAWLLSTDQRARKFSLAIFLWTLSYALFTAISTSARAVLLPVAFSFLCAGIAAKALIDNPRPVRIPFFPNSRWGLLAACLATLCFFAWRDAVGAMRWRTSEKTFASIDQLLKDQNVRSITELFSTDFDLYIRSLQPNIPYFNGGCPRWGTYGYNEEYPEFPVDSLSRFADACRKRGVRFVLLTRPAKELSKALGGLYENPMMSQEFSYVKEIGRFRIYQVNPFDK
jgi:hypothetical protein